MRNKLKHKIHYYIIIVFALCCFTPLTAFGTKAFYTYDEVGNMVLKTGDNDDDGISNYDENIGGTDPDNSDTDGDGMSDGWEVAHGLNPQYNDAIGDPDNDDASNYEEYIAGSNPNLLTDLVLSYKTVATGEMKDYNVENSIIAGPAYIVESGADVTLQAGNIITLKPGFSSIGGSDFSATVLVSSENSVVSDVDNDGISNYDEYLIGTDPRNSDTDGDGMPDAWELANGVDPLINNANDDPDNDSASNYEEYIAGTDPNNSDTDGDGMPDGWELANGLDPLINNANEDPDNDSASNYEEYLAGTNPHNSDTDGDDMPDGWEVTYGLDPLSDADRDLDPDSDGESNLAEYNAGTNPNIPTDLILANETISTGTLNYQAENSIISGPAYIIQSGANVTFTAGNIISLIPGFSANGGSDFSATIE